MSSSTKSNADSETSRKENGEKTELIKKALL